MNYSPPDQPAQAEEVVPDVDKAMKQALEIFRRLFEPAAVDQLDHDHMVANSMAISFKRIANSMMTLETQSISIAQSLAMMSSSLNIVSSNQGNLSTTQVDGIQVLRNIKDAVYDLVREMRSYDGRALNITVKADK